MKILWLTNIPSPYRVDFFCELGKYCELKVLFEKSSSNERDLSWNSYKFKNFDGIIMDGKSVAVDKAICYQVFKYLKKNQYDHIIVSDIATPTGIIAIEYMKARKIPYILEGDGGFAGSGKGIKETFKKHIIKGAKLYFSTSISHDAYLKMYGAKTEEIHRYPFTSIWESDICSGFIEHEKKRSIKNELGITSENIILSVGQFIQRKGYDVLLKASRSLENVDIYIIGGKPTTEYIKIIEELGLTNIHFIEFMLKEELKKYFLMSDLFVLPTREDCWGLVINEAMANGLPVITTDNCAAGIELITDYENGFIIPVDDENTLTEKVKLLMGNYDLRLKMAYSSINKIKDYTIEAMVRSHIEVLNKTDILFLGYAISKDEATALYGASVAGNKMQINILETLSKYKDLKIKCLTIYPTAAYPKGSIVVKKQSICLFDEFHSLKIGFINLPIFKQVFETIAAYTQAKKIIKAEKIETIFTFNMFPQTGLPAQWLKKKYGCKIVTLLADLPIDDTVSRKGIYLKLRNYFDDLTKKAIICCDKIIALNKNAVDLYAPGSEYIVIEGGVDVEDINELPAKNFSRKNLVYSGALVEYSGIRNLIEAMDYINDKEVILDIYGSGQDMNYVMRCAENMSNVKYHGKVDNRTMKKIQSDAYLLINPRPTDNPISKVTFPSKIFEYMISGTPILTTKLNGLTDEYLNNMFFVANNNPFLLAEKINEIMNLPISVLIEKAMNARKFVIENKTWEQQCEKIHEFIKNSELKENKIKESYE